GEHGEGFVMTTTEGITYTFDVYLQRTYASVKAPGDHQNARKMIFLLASEVRDRYGNTVTYQYNGFGHPTQIQSSAPDTRTIALTYSGSRLASASVTLSVPAQTRTWTYGYTMPTGGPSQGITRLTSVTLPDGISQWLYDYTTLTPGDTYLFADFVVPDSGTSCTVPAPNVAPFGLQITHPAGSRGEFRFAMTPLGRSNIPPSNCNNGIYQVAPSAYTFRLTSKTLYHADVDSDAARSVWAYGYSSSSCTGCTRTTITQPDASVIQQEFSSVYGATLLGAPSGSAIEGSLLKTITRASSLGAPLRTVTNTYVSGLDTNGAPLMGYTFPSRYGLTSGGDDPSSGGLRPLK
ncbi:MAG TPA: hypothetical protein VM555_00790, partial [Tahibacter sp.]|nr:hypothetical protein [Tahibacter sp.]